METTNCRLCLNPVGEMTDSKFTILWTHNDKNTTLEHSVLAKIEEHLCIKLEEQQDLSNIICNTCTDQLENWITFKSKCQSNNEYLISTVTKIHPEIVDVISNEFDDDDYFDDTSDPLMIPEEDTKSRKRKEKDCKDELNDSNKDIRKTQLGGKQFKCKFCENTLSNLNTFLQHSCFDGKERFECPDCPEIFESLLSLEDHLKYHKYPCPVCLKIYSRYYLWEHFPAHLGKFTCTICNRSLQTKSSFNEHMQAIHSNSQDYVCDECGSTFRTKVALNGHKKRHNKDVIYKCDQCEFTSHARRSISGHKWRQHTLAKRQPKLTCETCGKAFREGGKLTRHMKDVHADRRYSCHMCGHRFATTSNLKIHLNAKSSCLERNATGPTKTDSNGS